MNIKQNVSSHGAPMSIDQDWDAFQNNLATMLADPTNRGKYALVHDGEIAGIFDAEDDALAAGYDRFGIDSFLVQQIIDKMEPKYFSHNVKRCP